MLTKSNNAESILYWLIWGVIIIVVAIWRFWPSETIDIENHPQVVVEPVLTQLLSQVELHSKTASDFTLKINRHPASLSQRVFIDYRLLTDSGLHYDGKVADEGQEELHLLRLPNPKRLPATKVELRLSR